MPFQNRVTPFGDIVFSSSKCDFMGNRGCIHNNQKQIIAAFATKSWITCSINYKKNKRDVFSPGKYSELFFLDEATAFSAGHRPCALCRHTDFVKFKNLWHACNLTKSNTSIILIDNKLHEERIGLNGEKIIFRDMLHNLPDGTFVYLENDLTRYYLYYKSTLLLWSSSGYSTVINAPINQEVIVTTPKSIVKIFKAGYKPHVHSSANTLLGL